MFVSHSTSPQKCLPSTPTLSLFSTNLCSNPLMENLLSCRASSVMMWCFFCRTSRTLRRNTAQRALWVNWWPWQQSNASCAINTGLASRAATMVSFEGQDCGWNKVQGVPVHLQIYHSSWGPWITREHLYGWSVGLLQSCNDTTALLGSDSQIHWCQTNRWLEIPSVRSMTMLGSPCHLAPLSASIRGINIWLLPAQIRTDQHLLSNGHAEHMLKLKARLRHHGLDCSRDLL